VDKRRDLRHFQAADCLQIIWDTAWRLWLKRTFFTFVVNIIFMNFIILGRGSESWKGYLIINSLLLHFLAAIGEPVVVDFQ